MTNTTEIEASREVGKHVLEWADKLLNAGLSEVVVATGLLDTAANIAVRYSTREETAKWLHDVADAIERGETTAH